MDIMTILGWIVGFTLIGFGIVFVAPDAAAGIEMGFNWDLLGHFVDYPSLAITVGGTVAALMVAFPASSFLKIGKHLKICILPTKYDPAHYIEQIVDFAKEARMKGLLSLEDKLSETKDEFLKSSLMLVVDSVDPEKVHSLLEAELEHLDDRHSQDRAFYDKGGAFAPGFGMIGTLIGLVNMLQNMNDPDTIGPAMAVALITTFYGALLGNVVGAPIASILLIRAGDEALVKQLIIEGIMSIQAGDNPRTLEAKLLAFLPPTQRISQFE